MVDSVDPVILTPTTVQVRFLEFLLVVVEYKFALFPSSSLARHRLIWEVNLPLTHDIRVVRQKFTNLVFVEGLGVGVEGSLIPDLGQGDTELDVEVLIGQPFSLRKTMPLLSVTRLGCSGILPDDFASITNECLQTTLGILRQGSRLPHEVVLLVPYSCP